MTTRINVSETKVGSPPKTALILLFTLAVLLGFISLLLAGLFAVGTFPSAAMITTLLNLTDKTPWYLSRSAGIVAYLLLVASTIWGLLLSSKIVKEAVPASLTLAMHNSLSWLALAFTGLHGLMLLFDHYYTYTLTDLIIPFAGPYRADRVALGIVGFYVMLILVLSFQFRRQIGQNRWRLLHYSSFTVYVLAMIHGVASGTDSSRLSMKVLYLGSGLFVFFLTSYFLLTRGSNRVRQKRSAI